MGERRFVLKVYCIAWYSKSPWRNRLARSAVNRKVGGSSPPGDVLVFFSSNKICILNNNSHILLEKINICLLKLRKSFIIAKHYHPRTGVDLKRTSKIGCYFEINLYRLIYVRLLNIGQTLSKFSAPTIAFLAF